jgi:hypothetical protein
VFGVTENVKSGRDVMDDMPRSSKPQTEVNIAKVKEIVTENPISTLRTLFQSHESIRTILTNHLGMRLVTARLVPKD